MIKNLPMEKGVNIRDLGGMKTTDGKQIKSCCFLRASSLYKFPKHDVDILAEHGLKTVVDLRIDKELQQKPDTVMNGVTYYHFPLREDVTAGITHVRGQMIKNLSPKTFVKNITSMPQMYRNMVTKPISIDALKKTFDLIINDATPGNAVLWHCSEGKDRTEVVAAILLSILGVSREDIFEDYIYSNEMFKARNKRTLFWTTILFHDAKFAKEFQDMYKANPSMLEGMFDELDKTYGGVMPFVTDVLGFSNEQIDAFRKRVLEEV